MKIFPFLFPSVQYISIIVFLLCHSDTHTSVGIRRDPTGILYAGISMNISCIMFWNKTIENTTSNLNMIDPQGKVISPGKVMSLGQMGDRVSYYEHKTMLSYSSVLVIDALSQGDSGTYQCSGIVMATTQNFYIINATDRATLRIALARKTQ